MNIDKYFPKLKKHVIRDVKLLVSKDGKIVLYDRNHFVDVKYVKEFCVDKARLKKALSNFFVATPKGNSFEKEYNELLKQL